ncbi:MAG TPA: hypothetical protein VIC33_09085 [Vicinamibacterales bacterium]|jgi:hypothetical protein
MPTLTIRDIPPRLLRTLKSLAKHHGRSVNEQVLLLLDESAEDRLSALRQIEAGWQEQARRPEPGDIDTWIQAGSA